MKNRIVKKILRIILLVPVSYTHLNDLQSMPCRL